MITIGILDLQGDVSEHFEITREAINKIQIEGNVLKVKTSADVSKCHGIIISGGESTVIGKLMGENGIAEVIKNQKIAVMGTCAGMVLLGTETDYKQPLLGLIKMKVRRNGFGRQKLSFEEEVDILGVKFPGIFIRAPFADKVGEKTKILARLNDKIVAVAAGKHLAVAFHPELTGNTEIHEYFIKEVLNCVE
jgi:pyridoxal 5'-phosphate synthase pdxT subunit